MQWRVLCEVHPRVVTATLPRSVADLRLHVSCASLDTTVWGPHKINMSSLMEWSSTELGVGKLQTFGGRGHVLFRHYIFVPGLTTWSFDWDAGGTEFYWRKWMVNPRWLVGLSRVQRWQTRADKSFYVKLQLMGFLCVACYQFMLISTLKFHHNRQSVSLGLSSWSIQTNSSCRGNIQRMAQSGWNTIFFISKSI